MANEVTKSDMLDWFKRRGFWKTTSECSFIVLTQLDARQLLVLSEAVNDYGNRRILSWEAEQKSYADLAASGGIVDAP